MGLVKIYDAPEDIDRKIVHLARVSSENQDNPNYLGLLKYLLREKHFSPFDCMNVIIEVHTEKDVAIQLLRHQTLKPQEFSQRYADVSGMKAEIRECRLQDIKNRQNSLVCEDKELDAWWAKVQTKVQEETFTIYEEALKRGVAKELARSLLPIGLTSTKMYFNASVRSWLFYCLSRLHESTQKEHRIVAKGVMNELFKVAPDTVKAFVEYYISPKLKEYDMEGVVLE